MIFFLLLLVNAAILSRQVNRATKEARIIKEAIIKKKDKRRKLRVVAVTNINIGGSGFIALFLQAQQRKHIFNNNKCTYR